MATYGTIGEFNVTGTETWARYIDRLGQYFEANQITDGGRKRAILNSVVGPTTYELFCKLLAPNKPTESSFDEIKEAMEKHVIPTTSVIVERSKFNTRVQKPGESLASFAADLRGQAQKAKLPATLDETLRDRFVVGLTDERINRYLLSQGDKLTFSRALELAHTMELATQHAKELSTTAANASIQRVDKTTGKAHNTNKNSKKGQGGQKCYRCGKKNHKASDCYAKTLECFKCKTRGHMAKVCRQGQGQRHSKGQANYVNQDVTCNDPSLSPCLNTSAGNQSGGDAYGMYNVTSTKKDSPLYVHVGLNDTPVSMELDTGAAASIMNELMYNRLWGPEVLPLSESIHKLHTYTGQQIQVLGECTVTVKHKDRSANLPLLIVAGDGPILFGRNWLRPLGLDFEEILRVNMLRPTSRTDVLKQHEKLFRDELGRLEGQKVHVSVKEEAQPRFSKARQVPFALKAKVESELQRLESTGVLEKVTFSRWASPIVPVVKSSGNIRICGDYKATVNPSLLPDCYPLPRVEELFTKLTGGKTFSKLDLSNAYQQLELDDESRELTTINTTKGLYQFTRCPYGISTAPSIFQRTMDSLLADIPQTAVFLDDVLVTGNSEEEHLANLNAVMTRLENAGLRLRKEKCMFFAPEVVYLGHRITESGLQPTLDKVQAVVDAPDPRNTTELKSFLGLVNYYGKFIPQLSTIEAPLNRLLNKDVQWSWGTAQRNAFQILKQQLMSAEVLVHFNPELPLILSCDASPYGVGAVLAHRMNDGTERPVAFASRSLAPAEKNYSQLDREGLSVIFGVKKFHQYIYGRDITVCTDHKPLLGLFGESRAIPALASSRIQRWSLTLAAYRYKLVYKPGAANANADGFSRLPLPERPESTPDPADYVLIMNHMESTSVNPDKIRQWTQRDPVTSQVYECVLNGWPYECPDKDLAPYFTRRDELSVHDGCIMWGSRVIVPPQGRNFIIEELHDTHPGISRMKSLARSYVWWPKIDRDLETKAKQCRSCQSTQKAPAVAPLHPWEFPSKPWSRLHIDYAGPFMGGYMFLIVVDAYSKWMEVYPMRTATSQATIEKLRCAFATHGLPDIIVSDNGTCFTSAEFAEFVQCNGIKHVRSAPFHPASNGLAERAVQTFKESMKKMTDNSSIETKVSRFLFRYRITPHTTTGQSPAQLLMNRQPKNRLALARPSIEKRVQSKQEEQKRGHDKRTKQRTFNVGDAVYARNFARGSKWLPGQIVAKRGPLSFTIKLNDGRMWNRHIDHVVSGNHGNAQNLHNQPEPDFDWGLPLCTPELRGEEVEQQQQPQPQVPQVATRTSKRHVKPPNRYGWD